MAGIHGDDGLRADADDLGECLLGRRVIEVQGHDTESDQTQKCHHTQRTRPNTLSGPKPKEKLIAYRTILPVEHDLRAAADHA
jgi:hypothetical protein